MKVKPESRIFGCALNDFTPQDRSVQRLEYLPFLTTSHKTAEYERPEHQGDKFMPL